MLDRECEEERKNEGGLELFTGRNPNARYKYKGNVQIEKLDIFQIIEGKVNNNKLS